MCFRISQTEYIKNQNVIKFSIKNLFIDVLSFKIFLILLRSLIIDTHNRKTNILTNI